MTVINSYNIDFLKGYIHKIKMLCKKSTLFRVQLNFFNKDSFLRLPTDYEPKPNKQIHLGCKWMVKGKKNIAILFTYVSSIWGTI